MRAAAIARRTIASRGAQTFETANVATTKVFQVCTACISAVSCRQSSTRAAAASARVHPRWRSPHICRLREEEGCDSRSCPRPGVARSQEKGPAAHLCGAPPSKIPFSLECARREWVREGESGGLHGQDCQHGAQGIQPWAFDDHGHQPNPPKYEIMRIVSAALLRVS